ncbi:MAG: hypothetical protein KAS88_01015 [Deltaproteobacteria bacterium]|nr:hypothetical protein [Deltaproteobacteria bacterium]
MKLSLCHRRTIGISLAILLLLQLGCGARHHTPPPTEGVRRELGTIGIVSARFIPTIEFKGYAKGRGSGALRGGTFGALIVFGSTVQAMAPLAMFGPGILIIPLALAVPGGLLGALVGFDASESGKDVKAYEAAMKEAIAELRIQKRIRERTLTVAEQRTTHRFVFIEDAGPLAAPRVSPNVDLAGSPVTRTSPLTTSDVKPDYTPLATRGIDTVFELSVLKFGLIDGVFDVNPPLAVFMTLRVRLVSTKDNAVIYEDTFEYRGARYKLSVWAAESARLFETEIGRAYTALSEKVADDTFLTYRIPWLNDNYRTKRPKRVYDEVSDDDW